MYICLAFIFLVLSIASFSFRGIESVAPWSLLIIANIWASKINI